MIVTYSASQVVDKVCLTKNLSIDFIHRIHVWLKRNKSVDTYICIDTERKLADKENVLWNNIFNKCWLSVTLVCAIRNQTLGKFYFKSVLKQ